VAGSKLSSRINDLLGREAWDEARRLLVKEQDKDPESHWVLTQLGVTFYEQRRYMDALELFVESQKIVPDCPLTLWNLAGVLDALENHDAAMRIYTWILQSNASVGDDPCWESKQWTEALKTDCLYRLGACFQQLGKKQNAERCYREYLGLISRGIDGSYSIDDVKRQMRGLKGTGKARGMGSEVRKAIHETLRASGIELQKGRRSAAPIFGTQELAAGRRVASKR